MDFIMTVFAYTKCFSPFGDHAPFPCFFAFEIAHFMHMVQFIRFRIVTPAQFTYFSFEPYLQGISGGGVDRGFVRNDIGECTIRFAGLKISKVHPLIAGFGRIGDVLHIRQTFDLLKNSESFFRKINVHIIQCDSDVKTDDKITDSEALDSYLKDMQIVGGGATDFRPVFSYVEELKENHEFISYLIKISGTNILVFLTGDGVC